MTSDGHFIPTLVLLNVEAVELDTSWNWANVSSPFARVFFVTDGSAALITDREVQPLRPGHAYVIPPGTRHAYRCDNSVKLYYLHVFEKDRGHRSIFDRYDFPAEIKISDPHFRNILENLCINFPEFRLTDSDPIAYDNARGLMAYMSRFENLPIDVKLHIEGVLMLVFSALMTQATPKSWTTDERLEKVVDHINSNLDQDITINALADIACMAPSHFTRRFKAAFGIPPLQYVLQKKIARAQILLLTSPMTIKEVAWHTGFCDSSHFIRVFKRTTGVTPRTYRSAR